MPKQYRQLLGEAVLSRTISAFLALEAIDHVLPVINPDHAGHYDALNLSDPRLLPPVTGGATRQASVLEGLKALGPIRPDYVLIQDAARPLVTPAVIEDVMAALTASDGALPVVPVTDTIKRSLDGSTVAGTEDRNSLFAAQTPQGFRYPQILSAHMRASALPREFTDDAMIAEWAGLKVALTQGSTGNIKITAREDFARAERILAGDNAMETRVGTGFDVHPFEPGRSVWLGGVEIPHDRKLKGHSDADVALHALTDAIYGALGEGDIGQHFPPSDPQWKGAASRVFLEHAAGLVASRGGRIVNLDVTIVCETPRIGGHVPAMRSAIAAACGIGEPRVAIKATTSERLGFTGREEGIVAMASASIELPRQD
ncbi:2-C-methyl-D-erythritol 4-phosphate cytidylyltransferase [Devosia geojensis]|uniref:Bifunctional enzyme IspD/IspF n=1 Tax=Devosia geojensis TaxID=443610 RepID=A0A0F5FI80_9HYPH|nr:2-C-methyl-D-erythritol 4-phosphate cytidylyltransferase [Devosia geojensis]